MLEFSLIGLFSVFVCILPFFYIRFCSLWLVRLDGWFSSFAHFLCCFVCVFLISDGHPIWHALCCRILHQAVELERNSLMRSSISSHSASAVMRTSPSSILGRSSQKHNSMTSASSSSSSSPTSSVKNGDSTTSDGAPTISSGANIEETGAISVPQKDEQHVKRIVAGKKITALFEVGFDLLKFSYSPFLPSLFHDHFS